MGPRNFDYNKPNKPSSFKEVFPYLIKVCKDLFGRLFYIFRLVWETSPTVLILLSLIALLQGVMPLIGALASKNVINALQQTTDKTDDGFKAIVILLIALFIYNFASAFITRLDAAIKRVSGELIANKVRVKIMEKAREVDIASFDKPEFYEKLENASREASNRPIMILGSVFSVISSFITAISFFAVLTSFNAYIALVVIALALPSAFVNYHYRKKNFLYMRHKSKERRQMNYYLQTMINKDTVKEIRLFGLSQTFINRYKATFKRYFKGIKSLIIKENLWHLFFALASQCANLVFLGIIAYRSFKGDVLIGDYTYYTAALSSVTTSVASIVSTTSVIYEGTLFIDNIISFLGEKIGIKANTDSPAKIKRGEHSIELVNVSFKYPDTDVYVLKNVSFKIDSGESIVLVGLNGAGKTTLIKLITRLYDVSEGQILLDGIDIKDYEPSELYRLFGIIFQDFGRYAESVSDNISFGNVNMEKDIEKIKNAAKNSGADDFITKLEDGYETPLMRIFEDNGTELSVGQWQKLAVARAFYSDYDILILDEPTASLDALAEQELYQQFDALRKGKITLFVSHRLSSATMADKIVVLDKGTVSEIGNHKELMKSKGVYHKMFTAQAKHYIENSTS